MPDMEVVKTITDASGKRRVRIVRRDDGLFVALVDHWYSDTWEGKVISEGWNPMPTRASYYQTADMAEREARIENWWLS